MKEKSKQLQTLLLLLILTVVGTANAWATDPVVTYTYESDAAKATLSSNDYFSAASNPTHSGNCTFGSTNLTCTVDAGKTSTVTFTFTAKTSFELASFTINSMVNTGDMQAASIDYYKGSDTPTNEEVSLTKNSLNNIVITPSSPISLSNGDIFTIKVNLNNKNSSNKLWRINTITLTPVAASTYTVTYNGNGNTGGSVPVDSNSPYDAGSNVTVLGNTGSLVKTGYTFNGWNTAANGSGASYAAGATISSIAANTTLYAQWEEDTPTPSSTGTTTFTYTSSNPGTTISPITISGDGSYSTGYLGISNAKGGTVTITAATGYNIQGAVITYTENKYDRYGGDDANVTDGTNYSYSRSTTTGTISLKGTGTAQSSVTLNFTNKARITKIVVTYGVTGGTETYSVTYNGNSQTSGTAPTDGNSYLDGSTVTVLGNTGSLTKTYNTFAGWNTAADGTGTKYNVGETFSIDGDNVTLYAVYKHLVTIGVNDEAMGTASATYSDPDTYYDKNATDPFVSGSFVSEGVHLVLNAYPNDGYEFDATYDENHPWGRGTTNDDETGGTAQVGNNNDYIAHFKAKTYAITLDKNDGNVSGSTTATYNSSALADYSAATRAGYVLKGYYTATTAGDMVIDAEGNLVASVTGYTDGNAKWIKTDVATPTLYAQWDEVYTVTFDAATNEGTCATASLTQAEPGASITLPNASKEGNTFKGWFTTSDGDVSAGIGGATYTPEGNVTLYAQFTPIASGPKFHFISNITEDAIAANASEISVTTDNYANTLDGGSLAYFNNNQTKRDQKYGLKIGGNAEYLKITLEKALAIGDKITFDQGTGSNQISFTTTSTRSTTPATSENAYTITSTDGLAGSKTLYVWRATASTTYVKELTITSTGAAATYAISYDLAGLADEMDDMEDQETLPNPLPTPENVMEGYTFEGWYTDAAFTTRATAGATLGANTKLYANYIIDTPTITPASGAVYAGTTMTLSSSVPFTKTYIHWKTTGDAETKSYLETSCKDYNGEAIDTYRGFTMPLTVGTQYCSYMISDGTFYSRPAVTSAYTVSHLITINTQPKSATYVQNTTATALSVAATVTGSGTLSYKWKSSSNGSSWSDASGTNNAASYTPSTEDTGTTYYKCVVSSDDAASVESNVVTITVNAAATFTVSFDTGIGSSDNIANRSSSGDPITLPSLTVSSSDDYEFAGWYDGSTRIGGANGSYTPAGNITLTAKYNCKVTFSTAGGGGSVSAVVKGTSTAVKSLDKVLEGTEITITATPTTVNEFESWSGDALGTTNPVTIEVSDVTNVTANFSVSENEELFHTTFTTSDGWASGTEEVLSGTTIISNEKKINNTKVTFAGKSGTSYTLTVDTETHKLTYGGSNLNASAGSSTPNCYMAIHLTGVNGSITVDFGSSSQKWIYALDDGNTGSITTGKTTVDPKTTTFTIDNLQSSNVILYLGNKNLSTNEITITTPKTRLVADSAQVRFIGTTGGAVPVRISTNSPGDISIKTGPNDSYATATYNVSTKILTVTPVAAGETSVVMQVAQSGSFPAKELTIPIKVINPAITIKTQPTNLTCYQNEATEKKFTVVATVNTGNELTYQWYSCDDGSKTNPVAISGAISSTYILNTAQKAERGIQYYFCTVTCAANSLTKDTEVKTVTVSAIEAGGTYSTVVYAVAPGNTVDFTGLSNTSVSTNTGSSYCSTSVPSTGTLRITATTKGSGVITLGDGTVINVTVNNHTVQLIWSAESREYNVSTWTKGNAFGFDDGTNNGLPVLTRLYEDGTRYPGAVTFYVDDPTLAYFGDTEGTDSYEQTDGSTKPTIRYGGGQGGCKFYAYIAGKTGIEPVKASYDLRMVQGYSNAIPEGRKVEVQQQYTLWKNATEKLVTVTYGGYKYKNGTWGGKTDAWGSATNYVGKDNAIDGYLYAVRNKDRDAADEYEHAIQDDDEFGSAWYESGKGGTTASYQRIKPFRLPCRASYLTFTAHESGTLTAYVYQNGIVGRGGSENQLASGPRLGYWFDEEGWVQQPVGTVVTKQKIANANARDKRAYGGYNNMDEQMTGYWTKEGDDIVMKKLRSKWCRVENPDKDTPKADFSEAEDKPAGWFDNPYYWGTTSEVEANNKEVVPTPERPIPHQGGHMIVNEGYVKYTINVVAGKTYYFFGKMTKVGYAGMNFVPATVNNETGAITDAGSTGAFNDYKYEKTKTQLDLATDDEWSSKFSAGTMGKNTIYETVTVPSNYRIGKWNTICLPFAVNENQVEQVFGKGTELAIFNGLRHDEVNHVYYIKYLRHVDQNILPGQPYLIYPTGRAVAERSNQDNGGMAETGETIATVDGIIGSNTTGATDNATRLTFKNVIINKGITAQSYGCNVDADGETVSYKFTGTDKLTPIKKYDIYNTPKTGELKRYMGTGTNLNTYHALMKASDSKIQQDAITFAFTEDDVEKSWESSIDNDDNPGEATGIVIIEDEGTSDVRYSGKVTNGKTYNLMGQEVDSTSAKGIVIKNGKKVMY